MPTVRIPEKSTTWLHVSNFATLKKRVQSANALSERRAHLKSSQVKNKTFSLICHSRRDSEPPHQSAFRGPGIPALMRQLFGTEDQREAYREFHKAWTAFSRDPEYRARAADSRKPYRTRAGNKEPCVFVSALAARILPQTLAQKSVQLRMDSRSHFNAS